MSKQLVWPMIILTAAACGWGCATRPEQTTPPAVSPLPGGSFAQQWYNALRLERENVDQLHLRDETLFVYSSTRRVYAVSRSGGDLRYLASPTISGGILRPPLLVGDYVIYPSGSTIEVFNTRGRHVKTVEFSKSVRSGAVASANAIYIGLDHTGGTGTLASVNLQRPYHNINWEMMTFGAVSPTPVIFDRIVYAGSEDGRLYAVTEDRTPIWSFPGGGNVFVTQGRFVSDIKADEYGLYASNTDSKLYCLDRATGKIKWQYYSGTPLRSSPVVFAANVYQYVPQLGMVAIDKASGQFNRQPKWTVREGRQVLSEDQAHVYLRSARGQILAVDKNSGEVQFRSKNRWDVFATNMTDAMIYVATKDGKLAAVRPVLREGEVGTLVMDFRTEPVALAP